MPGRAAKRSLQRLLLRPGMHAVGRCLPISEWGSRRGQPVDRFYIEAFLEEHRGDIRGNVLEVKESLYTRRFGSAVERADVLDVDEGNRAATIHADLAAADAIDSDRFDCFVLTQTLQYIYDVRSAVGHAHRILKPGGVLLVTVPTVSRLVVGVPSTIDQWRFTAASCRALLGDVFGGDRVEVREYGNVLAVVAFLVGLASQDLRREDLTRRDEPFPVVVAARAVKRDQAAGTSTGAGSARRST